jgi:hypothetical protein
MHEKSKPRKRSRNTTFLPIHLNNQFRLCHDNQHQNNALVMPSTKHCFQIKVYLNVYRRDLEEGEQRSRYSQGMYSLDTNMRCDVWQSLRK